MTNLEKPKSKWNQTIKLFDSTATDDHASFCTLWANDPVPEWANQIAAFRLCLHRSLCDACPLWPIEPTTTTKPPPHTHSIGSKFDNGTTAQKSHVRSHRVNLVLIRAPEASEENVGQSSHARTDRGKHRLGWAGEPLETPGQLGSWAGRKRSKLCVSPPRRCSLAKIGGDVCWQRRRQALGRRPRTISQLLHRGLNSLSQLRYSGTSTRVRRTRCAA